MKISFVEGEHGTSGNEIQLYHMDLWKGLRIKGKKSLIPILQVNVDFGQFGPRHKF